MIYVIQMQTWNEETFHVKMLCLIDLKLRLIAPACQEIRWLMKGDGFAKPFRQLCSLSFCFAVALQYEKVMEEVIPLRFTCHWESWISS